MNHYQTAKLGLYAFLFVAAVLLIFQVDFGGSAAAGDKVWIGIETMELSPAVRGLYDIQTQRGVLITRAFKGSPAAMSGIRQGDILRRWNGVSVTDQLQLQQLVRRAEAGQRIKLTIMRKNASLTIPLRPGTRPSTL
ncbi:MAG: PDZ domain-containing protein [Planctomycetes bacterium]|nr:PDZ domain-containing protein [Planctomycetota bacterium]